MLLGRAGARRVDDGGVDAVELGGQHRAADEVARLGGDRPSGRASRRARPAARAMAGRGDVVGGDGRALGEAQREGADAAVEVGDRLRAGQRLARRTRPSPPRRSATACRKAPGGRATIGAADRDHRLAGLVEDLAVQGDAGEVGAPAASARRAAGRRPERPPARRSTPVMSMSRPVTVERHVQGRGGLRMLEERRGEARAGPAKAATSARIGDGADLDRRQPPGAPRLEADHGACRPPGRACRASRRREPGGAANAGTITVSIRSRASARRICSAFQAR